MNRHLLEWGALTDNQQTVWKLIGEEATQNLSLCNDDKVACFYLKKHQAERLSKLIAAQRHVRDQMKLRHQYEVYLLKHSVETASKEPS